MARTPPVGVAAAARALAQREEFSSTLPQIDCPTLVVVGAEDSITPVETLREIHEGIRGSRFEIIPGAGHLPPVEQPDHFARVLRDFLAELAGPARGRRRDDDGSPV
jgi:pimeloyl-ACP methyl ester carboxylesterase